MHLKLRSCNYHTYCSKLKIAFLVKEGKLEGITALRDESDKDGMRMVIELRRGEVPAVILNNLYQRHNNS